MERRQWRHRLLLCRPKQQRADVSDARRPEVSSRMEGSSRHALRLLLGRYA
jgi:hypothetical protein